MAGGGAPTVPVVGSDGLRELRKMGRRPQQARERWWMFCCGADSGAEVWRRAGASGQDESVGAHGLARPVGIGWQLAIDGGWVCEVWQSAYGHRANKATWLYYRGTPPPFGLRWERQKGSHQIGFYDQRGKAANKPTLGKREANATPLEFRDALISLASSIG